MSRLNFKIKYGKNEGIIISHSELIDTYFFGISLEDKDGHVISEEVIIKL